MNISMCSLLELKCQDRHIWNLASMCSKSQIIFVMVTPCSQSYHTDGRLWKPVWVQTRRVKYNYMSRSLFALGPESLCSSFLLYRCLVTFCGDIHFCFIEESVLSWNSTFLLVLWVYSFVSFAPAGVHDLWCRFLKMVDLFSVHQYGPPCVFYPVRQLS